MIRNIIIFDIVLALVSYFMATTEVIMDSSRSMWRSACARQR